MERTNYVHRQSEVRQMHTVQRASPAMHPPNVYTVRTPPAVAAGAGGSVAYNTNIVHNSHHQQLHTYVVHRNGEQPYSYSGSSSPFSLPLVDSNTHSTGVYTNGDLRRYSNARNYAQTSRVYKVQDS
jgi:hypothetical protein